MILPGTGNKLYWEEIEYFPGICLTRDFRFDILFTNRS